VRFDRIRLENFKCYEDADLRLDAGVTVIHGLNGSGKSSLLEACFFALYGSKALEKTLEEVVTIGAEETIVELWFTHAGESYQIRRRVRATGDSARTAECVLEGPDGTIEGAIDVRERIAELLRMDSEAFVNCAYVRQGEVNKLINATPDERQDVIDALLQLGKLETYRERASDARVGVGRVRDDKQGALAQVESQIQDKAAQDLYETLDALRTELGEVEGEIDRFEQQRQTAVETRDRAAEVLEEYEKRRAELEDLRSAVDQLRETIAETEREREAIDERIRNHRESIAEHESTVESELADAEVSTDADLETVEARIESLREHEEQLRDALEDHRLAVQDHEAEAEANRERAERLEARADERRERADTLEGEIEASEARLGERREKLDALDERIEEVRGVFEDAPVGQDEADAHREAVAEELDSLKGDLAELAATIEQRRESIAGAEALLEAGKCPECGQDVEGAPHVDSIEEDRDELAELEREREELADKREAVADRLERAEELAAAADEIERLQDRRETIETLIAEREADLADDRETVAEVRSEAEEVTEEATAAREAAAEAESAAAAAREAVGKVNRERAELTERRERLERAAKVLEAIADAESEIGSLRERRQRMGETNDERRQRLAEKRERVADLEDAVDERGIENARDEKRRAEEYIEKVDAELETVREQRDDLQARIGGVEQAIEELESLRERLAALEATVERLSTLYGEVEELESMYATLRAELRRRNVRTLERMLNDTFELVYRNASYDRIELDDEYELAIYQKDGERLDPEQLSGGERALFNLSLRCAIYRLLAEGIEGTAPMPPLVLDEPTVFLDSGHVSQLVELVERMRELGVEQIVVVSHDEELVGAADDLVTVEKDPTTNRSVARQNARTSAIPTGGG